MELNQEWMERMEKHSRTQARYAKLQCLFSAIAAVSCIFLAVIVIRMLPQIREFTTQLQQVTVQVEALAVQAESVMSNLETVTADLAQADLAGMVDNVDTLVTSSQAGLEEALKKINTMDIDALNKAIKTLSDVVEPLAKFFKVFG